MTEKEKKVFHKRKKLNLKIKQDFQVWLLMRIMATALLTVCMASVVLYYYSKTVVDGDYLSHVIKVRKISEVLLPVIIVASIASVFVGLMLALFLPQKIAGPIFRIEQDLEVIRTGDLTKIVNLRHADILKELAQSVNMAVQDIRTMINDVKESNSDLEVRITQDDSAEIKEAIEKQKKCLDKLIT